MYKFGVLFVGVSRQSAASGDKVPDSSLGVQTLRYPQIERNWEARGVPHICQRMSSPDYRSVRIMLFCNKA